MSRRIYVLVFLIGLFVVSLFVGGGSSAIEVDESRLLLSDGDSLDVLFFFGAGCSHCSEVEPFIAEMDGKYPLEIKRYDIYSDRSSISLFDEISEEYGIPQAERGVPTVFVGDAYFVGDNAIIEGFEEEVLTAFHETAATVPVENNVVAGEACVQQGSADLDGLSLLAVTAAALIDSVSPCSIAILVFLIGARVLTVKHKKRALDVGLSFCLAVFVGYFLFGLGLLSFVQVAGFSGIFTLLVGSIALFAGLFYIKDVFWHGKGGFTMEVPRSLKPTLMKMLKGVTNPFGAFLMGFVVVLFELPCTGGPYLVILGQLANNTTRLQALPLLLYYNFLFVLPLILISTLLYSNVFSVNRIREWNERNKRLFRLVTGLVTIGLGILVLPTSLLFEWAKTFLSAYGAILTPVSFAVLLSFVALSAFKRLSYNRKLSVQGTSSAVLTFLVASMLVLTPLTYVVVNPTDSPFNNQAPIVQGATSEVFYDQYAKAFVDSLGVGSPDQALGYPDHLVATIPPYESLILDMGPDEDRVADGPDTDFIIFEINPSELRVSHAAEYEVAVTDDLSGIWTILGTASGLRMTGDEFDLATEGLTSARYIRIQAFDYEIGIDSVLAVYTHRAGSIHAEYVETSIGTRFGVIHPPVVGDLDEDGNPEIIVVSQAEFDSCELFVIDGVTKLIDWSFPMPEGSYGMSSRCGLTQTPAIGDIDLDGHPELIVHQGGALNDPPDPLGRLIGFENDGSLIWGTTENPGLVVANGFGDAKDGDTKPMLENLDDDPEPEILWRGGYLEPDGSVGLSIPSGEEMTQPVAADLNEDGTPELVLSTFPNDKLQAIFTDGSILWETDDLVTVTSIYGRPIVDRPVVADLDGDEKPELIGSAYITNGIQRMIYAVSGETGEILWKHIFPETNNYRCSVTPQGCNPSSPSCPEGETCQLTDPTGIEMSRPSIADLDGDESPEIVVFVRDLVPYQGKDYVVALDSEPASDLDPEGLRMEMWRTVALDHGGDPPGVSTADLDGDGSAEVLWNGDTSGFTIFDGESGDVLFRDMRAHSASSYDYPVIADVDADGHLEVVTGTWGRVGGDPAGFYIFGDDFGWTDGREIWNQHDYRITNVDDDLSIPEVQLESWVVHNTYLSQQAEVNALPVADANGPYSGNEGTAIVFDGSSSYDTDGTIAGYEWDLDYDGVTFDVDSTLQSPSETWSDDYGGSVALRVSDDEGGISEIATAVVTVSNVAPVVDSGSDQTVYMGEIVSFSGSFTDPGLDTHVTGWNFGDGETATDTLTPTHSYDEYGVYTVTLTVTDDDLGVGTDTLQVTVLPYGGITPYSEVTTGELCYFDFDPGTEDQDFKLIFTQDPTNPSKNTYKLTASNPGQFYYNVFQIGNPGDTIIIDVLVPYPFVTKGSVPIHVYSGVDIAGECFVPLNEISTREMQITLDSYVPQEFGESFVLSITETVPASGLIYVTIHLDYGLKKEVGFKQIIGVDYSHAQHPGEDGVPGTIDDYYVYDGDEYTFSFEISGSTIHTQRIYNLNVFKRQPGFAGLVTDSIDSPMMGVRVEIIDPTSNLLATVYTDQDGFYAYIYKHKGKQAIYTVRLPDYGLQQQIAVKANRFVEVNFKIT